MHGCSVFEVSFFIFKFLSCLIFVAFNWQPRHYTRCRYLFFDSIHFSKQPLQCKALSFTFLLHTTQLVFGNKLVCIIFLGICKYSDLYLIINTFFNIYQNGYSKLLPSDVSKLLSSWTA